MRNMRLKAALGMAGVLAMTAACCVVGPALAADSASTADEIVRGGEPDGDVQYPGKEYIVENYDKWDKIAEEYAPEIIRYSNGQLVQRTPTEYECPHWMQQSWTISYNTYYLDADNRGCNSCHADMNAMIENMEYKHATIDNKALETYSDVNTATISAVSYMPSTTTSAAGTSSPRARTARVNRVTTRLRMATACSCGTT